MKSTLYFGTSSSCPGFPGQFYVFSVFTMLSRDFPWFLVIFEAFGDVSPLQVSSRKKAWDFPGFNSTYRAGISRVFPGFSMLSRDFLCLAGISYALPGFPMLSRDFPCLPGISHAFQGFFRFLVAFAFWSSAFSFALLCKESCRGEKNIMHSLGPMSEFFLLSFGQPLYRQPLALELWCYPWGTFVNQK